MASNRVEFNAQIRLNAQKGKKGFQPVSKRAGAVLSFKLTNDQSAYLKAYCKQEGLTVSELVRFSLQEYFNARPDAQVKGHDTHPNQLDIFGK